MNSKWIRIIGIAAVVAVVGVMIVSAVAFAQGPANGTPTDQYSNFVDLDGDGVCDTCDGDQQMGQQSGRRGGQNSRGAQDVQGRAFANMDSSAVDSQQMMHGKGQQGAHASPGMQGAYSDAFVDADGDGVCDNYGSFLQEQQGQRGQGRNW